MTRLKIGLRLGVAFGFVVLLGLLTAALAVARLNATSGESNRSPAASIRRRP